MSFGRELEDFVSAFQAGYKLVRSPDEKESDKLTLEQKRQNLATGAEDADWNRTSRGWARDDRSGAIEDTRIGRQRQKEALRHDRIQNEIDDPSADPAALGAMFPGYTPPPAASDTGASGDGTDDGMSYAPTAGSVDRIGLQTKPEIKAYIRQAARERGIDPNVAVRVWSGEGMNGNPAEGWQSFARTKSGAREKSYGPYQLYTQGGLGNQFMAKTGVHPKDAPAEQTIDFALDYAAQNGWGSWYGAKAKGVGNWQGIGPNAKPAGAMSYAGTEGGASGDHGALSPGGEAIKRNFAPSEYIPEAPTSSDYNNMGHDQIVEGMNSLVAETGNGAIQTPDQQNTTRAVLEGRYKAPNPATVHAALGEMRKRYPDASDEEIGLKTFGAIREYAYKNGDMKFATEATKDMLQYYQGAYNKYASIAAVAAQAGDIDGAMKAAVKAYANIPDGQLMKANKNKDGSYDVEIRDATNGQLIEKHILSPDQIGAAALKLGTPLNFGRTIMQAAGVREIAATRSDAFNSAMDELGGLKKDIPMAGIPPDNVGGQDFAPGSDSSPVAGPAGQTAIPIDQTAGSTSAPAPPEADTSTGALGAPVEGDVTSESNVVDDTTAQQVNSPGAPQLNYDLMKGMLPKEQVEYRQIMKMAQKAWNDQHPMTAKEKATTIEDLGRIHEGVGTAFEEIIKPDAPENKGMSPADFEQINAHGSEIKRVAENLMANSFNKNLIPQDAVETVMSMVKVDNLLPGVPLFKVKSEKENNLVVEVEGHKDITISKADFTRIANAWQEESRVALSALLDDGIAAKEGAAKNNERGEAISKFGGYMLDNLKSDWDRGHAESEARRAIPTDQSGIPQNWPPVIQSGPPH